MLSTYGRRSMAPSWHHTDATSTPLCARMMPRPCSRGYLELRHRTLRQADRQTRRLVTLRARRAGGGGHLGLDVVVTHAGERLQLGGRRVSGSRRRRRWPSVQVVGQLPRVAGSDLVRDAPQRGLVALNALGWMG